MKTNQDILIEQAIKIMDKERLDAFIIPTNDPHMSEYTPAHWQVREWLSGFTGSAGTLVITKEWTGLWTDSRYHLQAAQQLRGTKITLFKEGLKETPTIAQQLKNTLKKGCTIGIDGQMMSISEFTNLSNRLQGYKFNTTSKLISSLWPERPPLPTSECFQFEDIFAGEETKSKLKRIRESFLKESNKILLVTAFDEIAWILNLRGDEIQNNPVVISFLLISDDKCELFIDRRKVNTQIGNYLFHQEVIIREYNTIYPYLSEFRDLTIQYDPTQTNVQLKSALDQSITEVLAPSPIAQLKAIRNTIEIKNLKTAMKKDGVAMVQFLIWLEESIAKKKITELDVVSKLYELRSKQENFKGESFDTIAGYKEHGAIVHYSANTETNKTLEPNGLLLVDSGAQYLEGTTDLTRTIALGDLSQAEIDDYTLVLKGHIALASAVFPQGTRGAQLDVLARLPLWKNRKNFLHGTGHGVGHYLCVHEGPQSIRMNENPIALELGMVTSNEPGVYIDNSHGVRIENLTLVAKEAEGMYGDYYKLETLTLCPICTKGINKNLLSGEEIEWLNNYHKEVFNTLKPLLNNQEQKWLKEATKSL